MVETSLRRDEQFVGFRLAGETYGIPITVVREVIRAHDITRVPRSLPHIRGVINLRGSIVPVVDLRARLGLAPFADLTHSRIVVVEAEGGAVGMLVDGVTQVLNIRSDQVEPPPSLGPEPHMVLIDGLGKLNDELVVLLDVSRALQLDS